jgi:hypothetical protein
MISLAGLIGAAGNRSQFLESESNKTSVLFHNSNTSARESTRLMSSSVDHLEELCPIIIIAIITEMNTKNIPVGEEL